MTPKFIIVHHSAVSRTKNSNQFVANNNYHKSIGFPKSLLGFYLGYHYEINAAGKVFQARYNYEVGAHCKENLMNYKSIGIGLDGNFDIEDPTPEQIYSLRDLLRRLCRDLKLSRDAILFHRHFADYKSCPGKRVDLCFIRSLVG